MQDAQLATDQTPQTPQFEPALPLRSHTVLGVCEGLGEDIGIPPLLLRIAFAGAIFWNPAAAAGAYLGLGLIVLAARLLFPAPRRPIAAHATVAAPSDTRQTVEEQQELQLAA
ncbi:MAG: PspC domain-containing protein [Pseudomonadota bacterium]|jgi:phage shock protein PspC (stress-responsive transcriptional regulator)|nr:PspC domain-containing protein [Pseudomonadota bacterium]